MTEKHLHYFSEVAHYEEAVLVSISQKYCLNSSLLVVLVVTFVVTPNMFTVENRLSFIIKIEFAALLMFMETKFPM